MSVYRYDTKSPTEILSLTIDWSDWLASGETISTSTWTVSSGITQVTESETTTTTTIKLSSGTDGTDYICTNQIVTSASQTAERSLVVRVRAAATPAAYANSNDVLELLGALSNQIRVPTVATIDRWCVQYSDRIDNALRKQGYTIIPATNIKDRNSLGAYVAQYVAVLTHQAAFPGKALPASIAEWLTEWREFTKNLTNGDVELVGETPVSEDDGYFEVVRHPVRDDYFTNKSLDLTDWDE